MIAGEGFLRLHWYEKAEFDLRRRYPNDPRMEFVNEIVFSKCLVEDEPDCLQDAKTLKKILSTLLERLTAEAERKCKACGEGKYVGDVGATVGRSDRYNLHCDRCGHVISFLAHQGYKLPRWVTLLKNRMGVVPREPPGVEPLGTGR